MSISGDGGFLSLTTLKAGWGQPLPPGWGRGVSVQFAFDTYLSQVAEVQVTSEGSIKVQRIVCGVDCGIAVNPDRIAAQVEGGALFRLIAALYGNITLKNGRVGQGNFHAGGFGDAPTAAVAPAVTNAIFAVTGKRIRTLPIDTSLLKPTR